MTSSSTTERPEETVAPVVPLRVRGAPAPRVSPPPEPRLYWARVQALREERQALQAAGGR